jgi:hypothetical protein
MDAPFQPNVPQQPDAIVNQIEISRNGQHYVFRYESDDAFEMICIIMSLAEDKDTELDWHDVLEITERITSQALDDGIVV